LSLPAPGHTRGLIDCEGDRRPSPARWRISHPGEACRYILGSCTTAHRRSHRRRGCGSRVVPILSGRAPVGRADCQIVLSPVGCRDRSVGRNGPRTARGADILRSWGTCYRRVVGVGHRAAKAVDRDAAPGPSIVCPVDGYSPSGSGYPSLLEGRHRVDRQRLRRSAAVGGG